jgi:hypothetical protein
LAQDRVLARGMLSGCRAAAEQRDELASFQFDRIAFGPLRSQGRIAGYRIGEDQSGRNGTVLLGLLLGQYS